LIVGRAYISNRPGGIFRMMVLSLAPLGHRRCGRANGDVPPLQVQSEKARRLFARKSWRAKGIKRNEEKVKASETKARMAAIVCGTWVGLIKNVRGLRIFSYAIGSGSSSSSSNSRCRKEFLPPPPPRPLSTDVFSSRCSRMTSGQSLRPVSRCPRFFARRLFAQI
jgi:hypothetical protein